MASNHTEKLGLCQWEAEDQVLRSDFNADNLKIEQAICGVEDKEDKAVAELSSTLSAAISAVETKEDNAISNVNSTLSAAIQALESKEDTAIAALDTKSTNAVSQAEARCTSALETKSSALSASISALETRAAHFGNCTYTTGSYTGAGSTSKSLTFSGTPLVVFVSGPSGLVVMFRGATFAFNIADNSYGHVVTLSWQTNGVSWGGENSGYACNYNGWAYSYLAILEA
jgi:hypothetical protein